MVSPSFSKGPDTFAAILHALAVPAPHFVAWITILTELIGGFAILLGAFVSLVSMPDGGALVSGDFCCAFAIRVQFASSSSP